jgi:antitoxin VapB
MAILIKDPETDRIVRALAARTGETLTEAVRKAAAERIVRVPPANDRVDREKLKQTLAKFWAARTGDIRILDQIVSYDEDGLPI